MDKTNLPPLPEPALHMQREFIGSEYDLYYTAEQLHERDRMWLAKLDAARAVREARAEDGGQTEYERTYEFKEDLVRKFAASTQREAWAILRPDGKTLHPESVRSNEHAAQWAIGNWPDMKQSGFRCVPVTIAAAPTQDQENGS